MRERLDQEREGTAIETAAVSKAGLTTARYEFGLDLVLLGRLSGVMPVMMFLVFMVLGESRRRDGKRDRGGQDYSSKFLHFPNPLQRSRQDPSFYTETCQRNESVVQPNDNVPDTVWHIIQPWIPEIVVVGMLYTHALCFNSPWNRVALWPTRRSSVSFRPETPIRRRFIRPCGIRFLREESAFVPFWSWKPRA